MNIKEINSKFKVPFDDNWAFEGIRSVNYSTHGYHRYPAKFVPQIVKKIIENYTNEGDRIADVFAGCGTTLVEAKLHGRDSIGVDINPVAQLITNAKINPIDPTLLEDSKQHLYSQFNLFDSKQKYYTEHHERLDYWFREEEKNQIFFLYSRLIELEDKKLKDFYLCGLSNILKKCSKWLQSSTKPQVDPKKNISEPLTSFKTQINKMQKKNTEFYNELKNKNNSKVKCKIKLADARKTKLTKESVNVIITSPPYVTSYEYADIHQLTGYLYNYIQEIVPFRKQFIGTFHSNTNELNTDSKIGQSIVTKLSKIDYRSAREVANYFNDMNNVAKEMVRILKPNGKVYLVIGNTTMKGVKIQSAEAFAEMLVINGMQIKKVIKRKIPHKLIPTIRDKKTGKFTKLSNENSQLVYPEEYIIIGEKNGSN